MKTIYNSYGIDFVADYPATFEDSTRFRSFCNGLSESECVCLADAQCRDDAGCDETEEYAMKNAYHSSTSTRLNIYVVDVANGMFRGAGLFPWCDGATGLMNGVIVDKDYFGSGGTVLVHEIGHNLGLWHTFHGTEEVLTSECDYCAEVTACDGTPGATCDAMGDFCSDTAAASQYHTCVSEDDPILDCNQDAVYASSVRYNYMGYGGPGCWTNFTTQQKKRMNCWTCDAATNGWIADADCNTNGRKDICDLRDGTSEDCDYDGIPDECQLGACCGYDYEYCTALVTECACYAHDGITWEPTQYAGACSIIECGYNRP